MNTAIDHGLEPTKPAPVKPPLRLAKGNPLLILSAAKAVALKAEWQLRQWDEFRDSFTACFASENPEEQAKALDVVRSHFDVELLPGFSFDPRTWDFRQHAPD